MENLIYEVVEDVQYPGDWRAEAFDSSGDCFIVIFSGPESERRAKYFARFCQADVKSTSDWETLSAEEKIQSLSACRDRAWALYVETLEKLQALQPNAEEESRG